MKNHFFKCYKSKLLSFSQKILLMCHIKNENVTLISIFVCIGELTSNCSPPYQKNIIPAKTSGEYNTKDIKKYLKVL